MIRVKEILNRKGSEFWYIDPENTIFEALQKMASKDVGSILVMKDKKLVGIFSERDYARKIILQGLASKTSKVGDFMTKEVICVNPETEINDCMALMNKLHIRHLPVIENTEVVGVVSIGDVVNAYINQQHITISDLENYIYGVRM